MKRLVSVLFTVRGGIGGATCASLGGDRATNTRYDHQRRRTMGLDEGNAAVTGGTGASRTGTGRHHRPTRRRRLRTGAAVALCAVLLSACWSTSQQQDLDFLNQSRRQHGRPAVIGDSELMAKAQAWAEHLAATGQLRHSGANGGIDTNGITNWCGVAENVGYASSTWATHQAFMASAGHRANVLGPYDRAGTGVVRRGDLVWVVELYVRSC
jgi:uncharacterized protein YkwD